MRNPLASTRINRRVVLLALALAALLALTAGAAFLTARTGDGGHDEADGGPSPAQQATPSPSAPSTAEGLPRPPHIDEPIAFAEAAATALWSYDTRTTTRAQHLAALAQWMTGEERYADWSSVAGQVPDAVLWSRMADSDQHTAAREPEGHFPAAFQQALAEHPAGITEAYIYAVTVNGTQSIAWTDPDGGTEAAGSEERAITLAVQCRPSHDCALVAVSPTVMS
ncbi:hypothetical protein [Streptomyces sp. RFCAC02]|uniref:hypothetical protein n=1 Tax=Streptomyces sp. RFCAC02 TaxID=2499143 RepID=UPI0010228138|nr:hypothetical protein [Streptomyces sp. RFCAC02]